jgi:nucleoid-associated protein YgaU
MRPSIVRAAHADGAEGADGAIDGLLDAVSGLNVRDIVIETAHGKTLVSGVARYQLDRERLFEAIKQLDGWERDIVMDVEVERSDVRGYHTVRQDETLASIAERYLGHASKEMAIFEANRDRMNDPDQIMPGQQLLIPWR